ncbi:MAG: YerC/YecD family TrpR-related protein [Microgenomates group bacterium]
MPNIRKAISAELKKKESFKPKNEREKLLIEAIAALKNESEVMALLRDMLTMPEIQEFSNRITIAKRLLEGLPYLEIAKEIGTSTTTVTRVAHWLYNGCGGYYAALKKYDTSLKRAKKSTS